MPSSYLTRANQACLTALQIWDTELGPTSSSEAISSDVTVTTEIVDLLVDIIHAVRACLAAFRHQGKVVMTNTGGRANEFQYHLPMTGLRMSFNQTHHYFN